MLKLIGAIMIILSGTALGFSKAEVLKTRWKSLSKIIYSLRIMENEISYGKNSMDRILERIEHLEGLSFNQKESENAGDCFYRSVCRDELKLDRSDREILEGFSKTLGTTNSGVQLKNIKNTVKSLELSQQGAKDDFERHGKMYRSIGVLVGILAVIVLM